MATVTPKVGQLVQIHDKRRGYVRYIGGVHIAEGDWMGIELLDGSGKNDGSVKGERYFTCKPGYGIFVRKESEFEVVKEAATAISSRANGTTPARAPPPASRTRPAGGISPEVARKRQSLMSAGSTGTNASRVSVRSPVKSPNKPIQSSITGSSASTTRTGTPATTNRSSDSSARSRLSVSSRPPSMGPPTASSRTGAHAARPSIGGMTTHKPARPSSINSRLSATAKRGSLQPKAPIRKEKQSEEPSSETEHNTEPGGEADEADLDHIQQEERTLPDNPPGAESNRNLDTAERTEIAEGNSQTSLPPTARTIRTASISRNNGAANVETRAAQVREMEQLKAKVRTLEKQRQEDEERLRQVETLQGENDRYKNIIQALQSKMKSNSQELVDLRARYAEADAKLDAIPEPSATHESMLELATLDKETAEARAEEFKAELDALKLKHEEVELEIEILKEENKELTSVMSPEEKANAGWMQMERERERLRDALVMLRDMTRQTESDLRSEIRELQENLDEVESTAGLYIETAEKLNRAEETNRHLMDQLEAIEANDEVIEAMETQKQQSQNTIEQLKKQVQDFEEHIQVTDELEYFHLEEEKRLHSHIDEIEALLNESNRQNVEQDRVIEDLEYTLTKFRDVVQGLQTDIDELRRSRDISELQANEMSSKSRAMMDLNLRLQNNAAKSQSKVIDTELDRVRAELASRHVEILNLFTLDTYEDEKNPVLTLLCSARIKSKSTLVSRLLNERIRERGHLSQGEETFRIFEVAERMQWIANACERFVNFMSSCDVQHFASCGGALYELEPVERTVTAWLEALRRDELGSDSPEHLKRMQEILKDLLEKLIMENNETKATQIVVQGKMTETYFESVVGQVNALTTLVQAKLGGPRDEDDESHVFDKRMDQLSTKARTIKYLTGKFVQQSTDQRSSGLCLSEASWIVLENAEQQAGELSHRLRQVCIVAAEEVLKFEPENPLTYALITDVMTATYKESDDSDSRATNGFRAEDDDDVFNLITAQLNRLQTLIDDLFGKTSNLNSMLDFESKPAPWIVRAKELRAAKTVAPEVQDELVRLERRNQELGSRLVEREKTIEEMNMRVDLAEKRMRDSKARDDKDKALHDEVESLRAERESNLRAMDDLKAQLDAQHDRSEDERIELEALRKAAGGEKLSAIGTAGAFDESVLKQVDYEVALLKADIVSLQSGIRFLREENRALRIPITETLIDAAKNSWLGVASLDPRSRKRKSKESLLRTGLEREAQDVYSKLIDVASSLKPVRLSARTGPGRIGRVQGSSQPPTVTSWQPLSQTTRYQILKQREELETWNAWRADFIERAKIVDSSSRSRSIHQGHESRRKQHLQQQPNGNGNFGGNSLPKADGRNLVASNDTQRLPGSLEENSKKIENAQIHGKIQIVE